MNAAPQPSTAVFFSGPSQEGLGQGDAAGAVSPTFGCSHNGRPISVSWESTPALYSAIFSQEYDGAPDSHHPMGFGKTEAEAIADLIDQDSSRD